LNKGKFHKLIAENTVTHTNQNSGDLGGRRDRDLGCSVQLYYVMLLCFEKVLWFYNYISKISVNSVGAFLICYRRTRKCTKENFPEMGEFSSRTCIVSYQWSLCWSAWW